MPEANERKRPTVVITADFDRGELARLEAVAEVRLGGWGVTAAIASESETIELLRGADILVVAWEEITEAVLAATDLEYIASVRGGPGGNIDLEAAKAHGVAVTGTAGREAIPVAEFAIGLMIGFFRFIPLTYSMLKRGELTSPEPPPPGDLGWGMDPGDPWLRYRGEDLAAKTLGLVGLGTVGKLVAERAAAFGMEILAFDPFVDGWKGVTMVELDRLMSESDVISIHARYMPETHHLVGMAQIAAMKPTALLVNTARPNLVDREALLAALREKRIAGAALDVHHKEPLDPDDPMLAFENVICTPHIAGSTYGVTRVQSVQVVDNIVRFINGEALEMQVA